MSISEHKHMLEPVRRIEVFTGAGRRRSWSSEEKASIIAESYGEGGTVCAVARRHGLTPQQLFTWRRLARRPASELAPIFVPAMVGRVPPDRQATAIPPRRVRRRSKTSGIEFEIGGVEVRVGTNEPTGDCSGDPGAQRRQRPFMTAVKSARSVPAATQG